MIEMQIVGGAADDAFAAVALPHFEFHCGRNDSTWSGPVGRGEAQVLLTFDGLQPELEDESLLILLGPRVDQVEDAL